MKFLPLLLVAFLMPLLFPRLALAQDQAAAEALFRSAQEAAEQGDWVKACDRFEESNRLEPAPGTVLNIGRCREMLGEVASAWKSYGEAAERLPSGDKRAAFARKRAEALEDRVPYLTLLAPETDEQFSVSVRDVEFASASFGVALPFNPGKMAIVVRSAEREDFVIQLELEEGERVERQLELGVPVEESLISSSASVTEPSAPTQDRTWAIASFAVAGLGAGAAIFGGIWSGIERGKVGDSCPGGDCGTDQAAYEASVRGRTAVVVLATGAGVALVGAGLGTYFLLQNDTDEVALATRPGGAMLTWSGQW